MQQAVGRIEAANGFHYTWRSAGKLNHDPFIRRPVFRTPHKHDSMPRSIFFLLTAVAILAESQTCAETKRVDFTLPHGFVAEQIYEVPNGEQGSWICLTADHRGRLIASDQKGALYRLTVPKPESADPVLVEKIELDIGMAMKVVFLPYRTEEDGTEVINFAFAPSTQE